MKAGVIESTNQDMRFNQIGVSGGADDRVYRWTLVRVEYHTTENVASSLTSTFANLAKLPVSTAYTSIEPIAVQVHTIMCMAAVSTQ
jgi:hypothetical protein